MNNELLYSLMEDVQFSDIMSIDILDESTYISKHDVILNFDKWSKRKGYNILFITGLSGSGKSTLAKEYRDKYNAKLLELDGLQYIGPDLNEFIDDDNICNKLRQNNYEYDKFITSGLNYNQLSNIDKEKIEKIFHNNIRDAYNIALNNFNTLYIFEGIQIFVNLSFNDIIDKPIIIKETSVLTSLLRTYRRDNVINDRGLLKTIFQVFPEDYLLWYKDNKKIDELIMKLK